ncbi:MAG TPA: hypothetical protein GX720_05155 [Clostridiaceae bacterium]|nr:hypothetical protein [Clostridiaceae bacterium]
MPRPKHLLPIILMTLLLALSLAACGEKLEHGTGTGTAPSQSESVEVTRERAYEGLIDQLEKKGYSVVEEEVGPDVLQGDRRWLILDEGENLTVYLYEDQAAMEKDASYVSKSGLSYHNGSQSAKIQWVSDPHFFKTENMILLYVGQNPELLTVLEAIMGRQFAGLSS